MIQSAVKQPLLLQLALAGWLGTYLLACVGHQEDVHGVTYGGGGGDTSVLAFRKVCSCAISSEVAAGGLSHHFGLPFLGLLMRPAPFHTSQRGCG